VIFVAFVIFVPEPSARFSRSTLTVRHDRTAALKGCAPVKFFVGSPGPGRPPDLKVRPTRITNNYLRS